MVLLRAPLMVLTAGLLLGACGTGTTPTGAPTARDTPTEAGASEGAGIALAESSEADDFSMDEPPRFHVLTDNGTQLDLEPWTYCLPWACVDGAPGDDLPTVGSPEALEFGFDLAGWDFAWVTFREHGTRSMTGHTCGREINVEAEKTGDRTFRIAPAGPAGDWDVDIFGRGPGGDAVTTVHWRTPVDGAFPEQATGQAAVLADHDGELDSYGVELGLSDLDRHYPDATATITVTSAEGNEVTIPVKGDNRKCYSEGSLWFQASDQQGRRATTLGSAPFTYTARVTLAGRTYTGTGVWPEDTNEEITPGIPLTDWQPALPAYDGNGR